MQEHEWNFTPRPDHILGPCWGVKLHSPACIPGSSCFGKKQKSCMCVLDNESDMLHDFFLSSFLWSCSGGHMEDW